MGKTLSQRAMPVQEIQQQGHASLVQVHQGAAADEHTVSESNMRGHHNLADSEEEEKKSTSMHAKEHTSEGQNDSKTKAVEKETKSTARHAKKHTVEGEEHSKAKDKKKEMKRANRHAKKHTSEGEHSKT